MSTNPFRQTKLQQQQERSAASHSRPTAPDDSGSKIESNDLSLDTNVQFLGSSDRHVSFASPPVDRTITAAWYPSSPESARSPPWHSIQPGTPNYRTAFARDPFEDLGRNTAEDRTIQEALQNAQSNVGGQDDQAQPQGDAVQQTLGRFAPARLPSSNTGSNVSNNEQMAASRQSLDVEAFTRLLLTGDSSKNLPKSKGDGASSHGNNSISQTSLSDAATIEVDITSKLAHERERRTHPTTKEIAVNLAPPTPAPRRGKSIKLRKQPEIHDEGDTRSADQSVTTAATLQDRNDGQSATPSKDDFVHGSTTIEAPLGLATIDAKLVPPPPPIRRQHSTTQQRRPSDLASTAEEPGEPNQPPVTSRRSSADRPPAPPSRTSSASIKRQSVGTLQPPPVPPPRRGRESSRSSIDSFRPSLSSIMGDDNTESAVLDTSQPHSNTKQSRNFSSESILAELANLQKEVDAARRSA